MEYTYPECEKYINDIPKFAGKNSLDDTYAVLKRMYKDEKRPIAHIAGTNGKGSVSAYLSSLLRECGYKVGIFTSPHLVSMRERIAVNESLISEEDFVKCFNRVRIAVQDAKVSHPSFFEYLFLMAMSYFEEMDVDMIILETGLGGRKDATNCIKNKSVSVITRIGYDHMEYLGDTLPLIAGEKAGIIMEGVPVIYLDHDDQVSGVIEKRAEELNSKCYPIKTKDIKNAALTQDGIDFSLFNDYYNLEGLCLNTKALYQTENASLALMAFYVLKENFAREDIIRRGLKKAFWKGRMEEISLNVFLDGAHNEDGIRAFLYSVKEISACKEKNALLFSVVSDKEYEKMIGMIMDSDLFSKIYVTVLKGSRRTSLDELKGVFGSYENADMEFYDDSSKAYERAISRREDDGYLFIAGSLYLVGEIEAIV